MNSKVQLHILAVLDHAREFGVVPNENKVLDDARRQCEALGLYHAEELPPVFRPLLLALHRQHLKGGGGSEH